VKNEALAKSNLQVFRNDKRHKRLSSVFLESLRSTTRFRKKEICHARQKLNKVVNLSRAFCDPVRDHQIMSAAQHLALINTIRIRARIIN
jgi:hypothetical protein